MEAGYTTGGQAAVAALTRCGIQVVFGIPGGHNLTFYDALAAEKSIRHILGRHEQGLGFMADGYARAGGKIGVVATTSGPAVANMACAMGQATTDTSPVLVIASTVQSDLIGRNRGGLHDCGDAIEIMRPVCRYVRRCMRLHEIPVVIHELVNLLRRSRPGGAFCEIPVDVFNQEGKVEIPTMVMSEIRRADPRRIAKAADMLASARRPLLWVGTGAVVSNAGAQVQELAETLGAIVVPTTLARGIIAADHPNAILNDGASPSTVSAMIAEADVVLAVGSMFKQEDTVHWSVRFGGKLIHIDIDSNEIGRSYRADLGIVADAGAALGDILKALPSKSSAEKGWIKQGKKAETDRLMKRRKDSPKEMRALDILREEIPEDGVIVCDRCSLGYWAYRCLPVSGPRRFLFPMGYGGLGGALPQAIGAKLACPQRAVVCVIGDGGLQFTATELAVAVQEKVAITIVVCNNGAYGAIRANQDRNFGGRRFGCELLNPDFQRLAGAYGIPSTRAETLDEFADMLRCGVKSCRLNIVELTTELADP